MKTLVWQRDLSQSFHSGQLVNDFSVTDALQLAHIVTDRSQQESQHLLLFQNVLKLMQRITLLISFRRITWELLRGEAKMLRLEMAKRKEEFCPLISMTSAIASLMSLLEKEC
ncbi:hypothetical protein AVEN_114999-1 [Araneus ventricosus]|uniref:Uncharacterized protein n=1 Tax=Araneus ventricosus TaxID=182803 RepID=A0A4Y1ZWV9_ARAVE|nr:hypothetical protein AVEN_114999-1 [Araneus ventricosus]